MGEPISGAWARKFQLQVPYVDARKWGTGINPVHSQYGGPGRPSNPKLDANQLDQGRTPTNFAVSQDFVEYGPYYGYHPEDVAGLDVFNQPEWQGEYGSGLVNTEAHPNYQSPDAPSHGPITMGGQSGAPGPVNPAVEVNRAFIPAWTSRPWQFVNKARLHSIRAGETEADTGIAQRGVSSVIPMETVNEGWVNKGSSGDIAPGEVPDDNITISSTNQYERNTSMQQRHKTLNNERAMERGTDEARTDVASRIVAMKVKYFSGQEPFVPGQPDTYRAYDMFPYQIDDIPRPFTYRTAGTGPQGYLTVNEQFMRTPLQRQPPPDPSMGVPETDLAETGYGYSTEDQGYY